MIELIQQIITKQTNDTNSSAILRIAKKSNEIIVYLNKREKDSTEASPKKTLSDKIIFLHAKIANSSGQLYNCHQEGILLNEVKKALKEFLDTFNGLAGAFYPKEVKEKAKEIFGERLIK